LRFLRTSPGGGRRAGDRSKVLGQMRLVRESTSERNIAQGPVGLKHLLGSQFDATPDNEGVRRVPQSGPEGAREVRLAAAHQDT
jgi:hypothetical protein